MKRLITIEPKNIERRSFEIIEAEFYERTGLERETFDPLVFSVIQRVIHATGDFSFARTLVFQERAIASGLKAIKGGKNVYCDVGMAVSGVSERLLSPHGGSVVCRLNEPWVAERAHESGRTRTETALEKIAEDNVGIICIGNAPTALVRTMEMIEAKMIAPDLIIGVPVGFVNALESKAILAEKAYPFITCQGRKGGTPVAVAIINALLRIANSPDF